MLVPARTKPVKRVCCYATGRLAKEVGPCDGPWCVATLYVRRIYACEKHATAYMRMNPFGPQWRKETNHAKP